MMHQARRYLPEYREVRAKAGNFINLCLTPQLDAEVTLRRIRRFGFDAAIIFADILRSWAPNSAGVHGLRVRLSRFRLHADPRGRSARTLVPQQSRRRVQLITSVGLFTDLHHSSRASMQPSSVC